MMPDIATSADRMPVRSHPAYGLPAELKHIWQGRLYLASSEAGQDYGGFLEGALEAAEGAARKLKASASIEQDSVDRAR